MSRWRLCHVDALEEGSARGFGPESPRRDRLFLVKHEGQLHAWLNDCPHWPGSPMAWRRDGYLNSTATRIVCNGHGAEFDIASGHCTLGPCLGQSLTPISLEIDAQGWAHALIDAPKAPHGD
jgi:nitrite reductase/ring-hydroxylating ferredoxin subunit